MSWFKAKGSIDAVGNVVEKTGNALDKLFTSKEEKLDHAGLMERLRQQPAQWAHELNLLNAQDGNWFNSGWRTGRGWVWGLATLFYYVPQYMVSTVLWVLACIDYMEAARLSGELVDLTLPEYPVGTAGLWQLVTLLLGGSAIRQYDKVAGTAKE